MKRNQRFSMVLLLLITFLAYALAFLFDDHTTAMAAPYQLKGSDIIQHLGKDGCVMEEIRLDGWVKVNCEFMTLQELLEQIERLLPHLQESSHAEICSGETIAKRQVALTLNHEGIQTSINLYNCSLSHDGTDSWETYVIMDSVMDSNHIHKEDQMYLKMQELLKKFGNAPSIGTTYTAVIQDKLSNTKMEQLGMGFIRNLQGRITESNMDSDWISLTGYSNHLGGSLESEYGRFNINVALRYHSSEGKTYIRVGTPIIAVPY